MHKHELVEALVHKQDMPRHDLVQQLVHKQNLAELQKTLDALHPADMAYILEALPLDQRLLVWELARADRDGEILLEVSDAVRESLIASMDSDELRAAAEQLDTDEIADLAPDLPHEVIQDVFESLDKEEQAQLQSALSYPEGTVGALMDFDMVTIREDVSLEAVLVDLRKLGELPSHTDKLFVVDSKEKLRGVLPLKRLLLHNPEALVAAVMSDDPVIFNGNDKASDAASAFERYDLVTAPVVDAHQQAGWPSDGGRSDGFHPRRSGKRRARHGGLARRRRHVRHGMEIHAEPLDLARHQPGDSLYRLARDRHCSKARSRELSPSLR